MVALARVAGPRLRVLRLNQCTQIGDAALTALQVPLSDDSIQNPNNDQMIMNI